MMFFGSKKNDEDGGFLNGDLAKALLNAISDAVLVYDEEFRFWFVNDVALDLFEVSREEVLAQRFSLENAKNFKSKAMAQVVFPSLAPTVNRKSQPGVFPQIVEIILESPEKDLIVTTNQILDKEGKLRGFVKIIKDKTREEGLLKAKSDFIAVAAHQLRTPTTALNWSLENLMKESVPPQVAEGLKIASQTSHILLKTINDLLNAFQLEEGKFGFDFAEVDLVVFLNRILVDAENIAKSFEVKIYFDKGGLIEAKIMGDEKRLALAFTNIIDNAIKYNIKNGNVTLRLAKIDQGYEVKVEDTGVGIPEEDLNKVFSKFYRGENVVKFSTDGTGLGLFLTKNIVEKHGGTVRVSSILNRGTTFIVDLPTNGPGNN